MALRFPLVSGLLSPCNSTVLYDFNLAQLDGHPHGPFHPDKFHQSTTKWYGVEPLGVVLKDLTNKAVVGYAGCYKPSVGSGNSSHAAASLWADLREMGKSNLECPFKEDLQKMLPVAAISQRDIDSLQDSRQIGSIKLWPAQPEDSKERELCG